MAKRIRLKKTCIVCGEYKEHCAHGKCKSCYSKERNKDPDIMRRKRERNKDPDRMRRKREHRRKPLNKKSSNYLGCTIAEKVLSKVFNDVKVMPPCNPGFDFFCNKGKKIDVKSSCFGRNMNWVFHTNRNTIADFFLCIAFDNRQSLTPLYLWLIPSDEVKDKVSVSISPSTLHKWDKFKLDISETLQCCDQMRG